MAVEICHARHLLRKQLNVFAPPVADPPEICEETTGSARGRPVLRSPASGIFDLLLAFPPAQIGVDNVALDRTESDDGDLDDEIADGSLPHARRHGHLRATFDLEGSEHVGLADHRIGRLILLLDSGEIDRPERLRHAGQHAERQPVVLVPFDHLSVGHACRLDRHEIIEPVVGEQKAARMLAEMVGRAISYCANFEVRASLQSSGLRFNSRRPRSVTSSSEHDHTVDGQASTSRGY